MLIYTGAKDIHSFLLKNKSNRRSIGFVPTMGALHSGHLSLIENSKKLHDITVCSIFVNPSQFNQKDDFEKYPITTSKDIELLLSTACDVLFLPSTQEIYPAGWNSEAQIDIGDLANIWEGHFRPGHFAGVVQIVKLLLEIIVPNAIYMGQKDYQQCLVIDKLIKSQHFDTQLHMCPIIREADGLAMSSRNSRLSASAREDALVLYKALCYIKDNFQLQSNHELLHTAESYFHNHENIKLEYIVIADRNSLSALIDQKENAIVLVVAWIDGVRLLDNSLL